MNRHRLKGYGPHGCLEETADYAEIHRAYLKAQYNGLDKYNMAWLQYIEAGSKFRDTRDDTLWECFEIQKRGWNRGSMIPADLYVLIKISENIDVSSTVLNYSVAARELDLYFEPLDRTLQKIKLLDKVK